MSCSCRDSETGERDGMNEFLKIYQQMAGESNPMEDATAMGPAQPTLIPTGRNQPQGRPQAMGGREMMGGTQRVVQPRMENDDRVQTRVVAMEDFIHRKENVNVAQLNVDFEGWEDDPEVKAKVR